MLIKIIFIKHFKSSGSKPFTVEAGELIKIRYYFPSALWQFWVEAIWKPLLSGNYDLASSTVQLKLVLQIELK